MEHGKILEQNLFHNDFAQMKYVGYRNSADDRGWVVVNNK